VTTLMSAARAADTPPVALPVRELVPPPFPDANSVWGATGRDDAGNVWIGVSAKQAGHHAHLMRYEPGWDVWTDAGAVDAALRATGGRPAGEGQTKIHSRIVEAEDGWLYLASLDEEGERDDGSVPPRWGGHLWRVDPRSLQWQHVLAVPEGLIALGGGGRYLFALGYWGHVLYCHDVRTGTTGRVEVGSVGGHVSRNLVADDAGHAWVPRVTRRADGGVDAGLAAFDAGLTLLATTPLPDYFAPGERPESNHGITGWVVSPAGTVYFTTHHGRLYRIDPGPGGTGPVTSLGFLHPEGRAYAPSLFLLDDGHTLAGAVQREERFEFVTRHPGSGRATVFPIDTSAWHGVLLYGSAARDDAGGLYLGGRVAREAGGHRPLVLRVGPVLPQP
jgi:hypothetical protein